MSRSHCQDGCTLMPPCSFSTVKYFVLLPSMTLWTLLAAVCLLSPLISSLWIFCLNESCGLAASSWLGSIKTNCHSHWLLSQSSLCHLSRFSGPLFVVCLLLSASFCTLSCTPQSCSPLAWLDTSGFYGGDLHNPRLSFFLPFPFTEPWLQWQLTSLLC